MRGMAWLIGPSIISARSEHAVADVAEAGQDVAGLGDLVVDRRSPDVHVRVMLADGRYRTGRGEYADDADCARADLFQSVDRGDGGISGRQHRMQNENEPVADVVRRLEEIFNGHQRARVAVDADMGDARGGHEIEHAVEEAAARAADRR